MPVVKVCIGSSGILKDRFEVLVREAASECLKPGLVERVYDELLKMSVLRQRVVVTFLMNRTEIKIKMDMVKSTSLICLLGIGLGLGLGSLLIYKLYDCLWTSNSDSKSSSSSGSSTTRKDTDSKNNNVTSEGKERSEKRRVRRKNNHNRKRSKMGNHNTTPSDYANVSFDGINNVQFLHWQTADGTDILSTSPSYPGTHIRHRTHSTRPRKKSRGAKSPDETNGHISQCWNNRALGEKSSFEIVNSYKSSPLKNQLKPLLSCSLDTSDSDYENEGVFRSSRHNSSRESLNEGRNSSTRQRRTCSTPTNLAVQSCLSPSDAAIDGFSMIANFSPCSLNERNFRLDTEESDELVFGANKDDESANSFEVIKDSETSVPPKEITSDSADWVNLSAEMSLESNSLPSNSWEVIQTSSSTSVVNSSVDQSDTTIIAADEICNTNCDSKIGFGGETSDICGDSSVSQAQSKPSSNNHVQFCCKPDVPFVPRSRTTSEPSDREHMNNPSQDFTCEKDRLLSEFLGGISQKCTHKKSPDGGYFEDPLSGHRRTSSLGGACRGGSVQRELDEYEYLRKREELRDDVFSQTSSNHSSPMRQRLLEQLGYTSDTSDTPMSPQTLKEIFPKRDWSTFSDINDSTGNTTPYESDDDYSANRIDRLLNELEDVKSEVAMMSSKFVQLNSREYVGELYRTTTDPYPLTSSRRSSNSNSNSDKDSPTHAHQILKKYKLKSPKNLRTSRQFLTSPNKTSSSSERESDLSLAWDACDLFNGIVIRGETMTVSLTEKSDSGVSSVVSSENHSKVTSPETDNHDPEFLLKDSESNMKPGEHYQRDKNTFIEEVRNISQDLSFLIQHDLNINDTLNSAGTETLVKSKNSGKSLKQQWNCNNDVANSQRDVKQDSLNNEKKQLINNLKSPRNRRGMMVSISDEDTISVPGSDKTDKNSETNNEAMESSDKDQLSEKAAKFDTMEYSDDLCEDGTTVRDSDNEHSVKSNSGHTDHVPKSKVRPNIGELCKICNYVSKEWKGSTEKAKTIRQGYNEIVSTCGFHYLRQIRGDNYCAIRASLYQVLVNGSGHMEDINASKQKLENLLNGCHSYLKNWSFAGRIPIKTSTQEQMVYCLDKLESVTREVSKYSSYRTREERILELFNATDSLDQYLMEGVKILMMLRAIELHDASNRGEDVPVFVWLMYARDTSETPAMFMKNHLNSVGDSFGLEQVEMFLLADCLGVGIHVMRPSQHGQFDFVTYFPDDTKDRGLPLVSLIAEDDRHYNVAG